MELDRTITSAITFFIVLALAYFWVVPEFQTLQTLQLQLAQKKAQYNAEYDYYAQVAKDYYDIQNKSEDVQKIDDALPSDANYGQLIYYFQKQAGNSGLILKNAFLSQSSETGSVKNLVFSLNLLGSYSSLENFIISLEKSARLFEVSNISFGSTVLPTSLTTTQFQAPQTFNFSLEIKTHSY